MFCSNRNLFFQGVHFTGSNVHFSMFFLANGFKHSKIYCSELQLAYPPKSNMEPQKLVNVFPFPRGLWACYRFHVSFRGCIIHKTYSNSRNVTRLPFGRNLVGQRTTFWCPWKIQYTVYICLVELETNQQMKNW